MERRLLVLPREISQTYEYEIKIINTANNCCEKSAEAIVDGRNELINVNKIIRDSQFIEGLNLKK